jgi:hypothetical protein
MAASILRFLQVYGPAPRAGEQIDVMTDPVLIDDRKRLENAGHRRCAEDLDLEKLFTGTLSVPAGPAPHFSSLSVCFRAIVALRRTEVQDSAALLSTTTRAMTLSGAMDTFQQ